jgi:hypothetical protein
MVYFAKKDEFEGDTESINIRIRYGWKHHLDTLRSEI